MPQRGVRRSTERSESRSRSAFSPSRAAQIPLTIESGRDQAPGCASRVALQLTQTHKKLRYHGLAKNTAQLYILFALANLVIVKRPRAPGALIRGGDSGFRASRGEGGLKRVLQTSPVERCRRRRLYSGFSDELGLADRRAVLRRAGGGAPFEHSACG
jgi:hypothetical protein